MIFQHSNLDLPAGVERGPAADGRRRRGCTACITRRASVDTNANFSSLLSWWDRLHGTLRLDVPQSAITIEVAGFLEPRDVTLEHSLDVAVSTTTRASGADSATSPAPGICTVIP